MKSVLLAAALTVGTLAAQAQTTWSVDNAHTKIGFTVTHLTIADVDGFFRTYDGSVVTKTADDFTGATVSFNIDPKTINTETEARDKHLQQDEFFDTEKFPKIEFKGGTLRKVSGKNYKLDGTLTIKGVTKPISLDVVMNGIAKDPWGNTKAGFKFTGKLKRTDFGVGKPGGAIVGEEIAINGAIELKREEKKG